MLGHGAIKFRAGDDGFGIDKAAEALDLALTLDDPGLEWRAVHFRAGVAIAYDDGVSAARDYAEALALARRHGLAAAEAVSVYSLGAAAWVAGDPPAAGEFIR